MDLYHKINSWLVKEVIVYLGQVVTFMLVITYTMIDFSEFFVFWVCPLVNLT